MADDTYEPPKHGWTCFHCGETFKTFGSARDHFGADPSAQPGCLIDQVALEEGGKPERGRGLLVALRKVEAELTRYREEDTELHREIHRLHSDHRQALVREEEKGYARGLRDGVNLPADSPERAALVAPRWLNTQASSYWQQGCDFGKAGHRLSQAMNDYRWPCPGFQAGFDFGRLQRQDINK